MKFRAEIDGLRAIAVLSVVLYHANLNVNAWRLFSGGFVGVDIFFVISGYLITRIVLEDAVQRRFSYLNFYERRFRRIAPVLLLVMVVSVPASLWLMMPEQLMGFGKSLVSALAFLSNIYFWKQDGYFAEVNEFKPFLHTWSLSVEEQFYLFFPPAILFLQRHYPARRISVAFLVGLVLTWLFAVWLGSVRPVASFFLLPARAWELLAGGWLAQREMFYGRPSKRIGWPSLMPSIGILFILVFVFFVRDSTPHIALYTLLPVMGAMLILWFGGADSGSRCLSKKWMLGVGAISYSLYLWHQPIFAFARIGWGEGGILQKCILIFLTVVLAVVSYRYIEGPFRRKNFIPIKIFSVCAACSVVLLGYFTFFVNKNDGYPSRFPGAEKAVGFQDREYKIYDSIKINCADILFGCAAIDFNKNYWLLIGDSYAKKMLLIQDELKPHNIELLTSVALACPFLPGVLSYDNLVNGTPCEKINQMRLDFLKKLKPATIVYVARTTYFVEGRDFDVNIADGAGPKLNIKLENSPDDKDIGPEISQKFKETIEFLLKNNNRVVLVYPIPEFNVYAPNEMVRVYRGSKTRSDYEKWLADGGVHIDYEQFKRRSARSYQAYDAVADSPSLLRIYPETIFCNRIVAGQCNANARDAIYYNDPGHLSSEGALLLNKMIVDEANKKWGSIH